MRHVWFFRSNMPDNSVIIVGGGLAGLSAAHTVLERGGNVILLDKCAFLGGKCHHPRMRESSRNSRLILS